MDELINSISEQLEREVATQCRDASSVGGAFGIVRGQELVWSHGYGYSDIERDDSPDENTLFRIASITKTFTATAIFQLRDQGKLSLDDPVLDFLPEFAAVQPRKGRVEDVTLRRILSHHSGLVGYADTGEDYYDTLNFPDMQTVLNALPRAEIAIPPDTEFKYSNLGVALLGEVIARCSSKPYEDYVSQNILSPLGMDSTTFEPDGPLITRVATGYQPNEFGDDYQPAPRPNKGFERAASQLYSTVVDLAKWISLQFLTDGDGKGGEQILSPGSLREMQRPQFLESGWTIGACLPWSTWRIDNDVFVGHGGYTFGYRTHIAFHRERSLGVITLYNGRSAIELSPRLFGLVMEAEDCEEKPLTLRKPSPTPEALREYLGVYLGPLGLHVKLEYQNDRLQFVTVGSAIALPPIGLETTDEVDLYRMVGERLTGDPLRFTRTADGAVSGCGFAAMHMRKLVEAGDR